MPTRKRTWILIGSVAGLVALVATLTVSPVASAAGGFAGFFVGGSHDHGHDDLALTPTSGTLTPTASGRAEWHFSGGVLSGVENVHGLPAQGSHLAYVLWYVNNATGDKTFLGPLVEAGAASILFQFTGDGYGAFTAGAVTAGPNAGSPITLAPPGQNLLILLVENAINFASPSPIGTSVSGTF